MHYLLKKLRGLYEDVVEELFGEIEDEHDVQELIDVRINENEFKLSS